jgi:hypothetical protein
LRGGAQRALVREIERRRRIALVADLGDDLERDRVADLAAGARRGIDRRPRPVRTVGMP